MCEPVTASILIAGQVATFAQGSAQASAANKVNARNRELINTSARNSFAQIDEKVQEEAAKAGQAIAAVRSESAQAQATTVAAAVEGGVTGTSVEELQSDFERQEGERVNAVLLNQEFVRRAAHFDKESVRIGQEGRLLSASPVQGPSLIGAALSAGAGSFAASQSARLTNLQIANQSIEP